MKEKSFVDRMIHLLFSLILIVLLCVALYLMLPDARKGLNLIFSFVHPIQFFHVLPFWIQVLVGGLCAILALICIGALKDLTAMIFGWQHDEY